jgi:hypothetical protein
MAYFVLCKKETVSRCTEALKGLWVQEELSEGDQLLQTQRWELYQQLRVACAGQAIVRWQGPNIQMNESFVMATDMEGRLH